MDFFAAQDNARRQSRWLVLWFVLAVCAVVGCIYVVARWVVHIHAIYAAKYHKAAEVPWWDGQLFAWVALGAGGLILGGSLYKSLQLARGGGHAVAMALGARMVARSSREPHEWTLLNIVDEMAIASGIVPPRVYILDRELGLNAFAAGAQVSRAAVIVTRGLLEHLNRDELQGVVAHEFGHILNGDMRLNLRLAGLLHGLLLLVLLGRLALTPRIHLGTPAFPVNADAQGVRAAGSRVPVLVLGVTLIIVGSLGLLFGNLIKAAISRQREFLADASAVQFTRWPGGLAGALRKIARGGSKIHHPNADEFSHMFFGANSAGKKSAIRDAFAGDWIGRCFATHPPIEERIARVDPGGRGEEAARRRQASTARAVGRTMEPLRAKTAPDPEPEEAPLPDLATALAGMAPLAPLNAGGSAQLSAATLSASVGEAGPEHLAHTRRWLYHLPLGIQEQLRDPHSARSLLLGMLLSPEPATRRAQLDDVVRRFDPQTRQGCEAQCAWLDGRNAALRLPLLDMLLATLGQLPAGQRRYLADACCALLRHEGERPPLPANVLCSLVRHSLAEPEGARRAAMSPATLRQDAAHLLAWMALAGHMDDLPAARAAWRTASQGFALKIGWPFAEGMAAAGMRPTPEQLAGTLQHLAATRGSFRKSLIEACTSAILHDGRVTALEAELLRGVCQALNSPVPPHLNYGNIEAEDPPAEQEFHFDFDWKAGMDEGRLARRG